ncbi:efflux RND transporter periplasmic adaptor subunit [Roseixanthobacter glucoisosaccharinicivorans]|uniref:efflux RND transporter periplasmic adaptor subunit n=1 Tax=Roseixanthobacter glucoisosaccharinicivorans TaxID=3119923 RepID=UPI00372B7A13
MKLRFAAVCAALLVFLSACNRQDKQPPVLRPVLSIIVAPSAEARPKFAGVIQARYLTERAFQVLGRIVARKVEVGETVHRGQVIAENDPLPYQLAVRSSEADLANATSRSETTTAQLERTRALFKRNVTSQADLDAAQQAMEAAAAALQQAEANLAKAREQLSYTTLTADIDGVVLSIDAEVGQMASPGMKVMTLARTDVREAVVDVPDDIGRALPIGAPFDILLQANPSIRSQGKVREISPQADSTTRLRRIRITLESSVEAFRLGATITAIPVQIIGPPTFDLPRTAIFERDGESRVWLVDSAEGVVRSTAVEIIDRRGSVARVARGLEPGARVVTAGANSLSEGQKVKLEVEVVQ